MHNFIPELFSTAMDALTVAAVLVGVVFVGVIGIHTIFMPQSRIYR